MIKAFRDALEAGLIEPASLPDGKPFIVEGIQYYQATEKGRSLMMYRHHRFSDLLRRHDIFKLSDDLLTTSLQTMQHNLTVALAQFDLDFEQAQDNLRRFLYTVEHLEQRHNFGLDIAQVYDIASVWFFSEEEDPQGIDAGLHQNKVEAWLRHPHLYGLFLSLPIGKFVPVEELFDLKTLEKLRDMNIAEVIDLNLMVKDLTPEDQVALDARRKTLLNYEATLKALTTPNSAAE
ncbi:hypothetical protein [Tellurirhabdus bombi]|uniref:hypothetical protein n=1 Tax=Tellurirhabdus bombi TaxID=2907205 RepID=UPI001F46B442|nr:hypothetical protein [Tellurirhabdus bombi]